MKLKKQLLLLMLTIAAGLSLGCVSSAQAAGWQANPLLRFGLSAAQRAQLKTQATDARNGNTYLSEIESVSCARHDDCEAVGARLIISGEGMVVDRVSGFAEHWNGTSWTHQMVVNPTSDTTLISVSCYAPDSCIAVGAYSRKVDGPAKVVPLTERWNGVRWTQVAIGAPKLEHSITVLRSVSCQFDGRCTAIGEFARGDLAPTKDYAVQFNGSRWTRITTPAGDGDDLVSCPATGDCFSISVFGSTVFRQQNGHWRIQKLQLPKNRNLRNSYLNLNSLSCASVDDCVVTGSFQNLVKRGRYLTVRVIPIVEHFNGIGWHRMLLPGKLYNANSWADGIVSCSSPGHCVAGGFGLANGSTATLVLNNGAWHIATIGKLTQTSISCPDSDYCVAMTMGYYSSSKAAAAAPRIASIFNGKRWRVVRMSLPAFKLIA